MYSCGSKLHFLQGCSASLDGSFWPTPCCVTVLSHWTSESWHPPCRPESNSVCSFREPWHCLFRSSSAPPPGSETGSFFLHLLLPGCPPPSACRAAPSQLQAGLRVWGGCNPSWWRKQRATCCLLEASRLCTFTTLLLQEVRTYVDEGPSAAGRTLDHLDPSCHGHQNLKALAAPLRGLTGLTSQGLLRP